MVSVTKVLGRLDKPQIEMAISASLNPNSQYFGMLPEKIQAIWKEAGKISHKRGNPLHHYAQALLEDDKLTIQNLINQEDANLALFRSFNTFKKKVIDKNDIKIICLEQPLCSPTFRLGGTPDAIFYWNGYIFIFDWKTNKVFKEYSNFQVHHEKIKRDYPQLTNSHLHKYTLQLQTYRWILENEYGLEVKGERIVWLSENDYQSYKPAFGYKENFIYKLLTTLTAA